MVDRIDLLIKQLNISIRAFEQSINASNGLIRKAITNNTDIQSKWITAIVDNYPLVNSEWLLTGEGDMFKSDKTKIQTIHKPPYTEKQEDQEINLYDVSAAANLKTLLLNKNQNILGKISIPDAPKCDGAVYINGDSMYPLLKSGDIVAYKGINNFDNLVYGEMYLISYDKDGDEFLTVKYIQRSENNNCIKLVSYNPHHDPMDIPKSAIMALAIVKFSVRKNTMI